MNNRKQIEAIANELSRTNNPGRFGRAKEIERARVLSRKDFVAGQGKIDNHVKFSADNKRGYEYVPAESKTSGGRVNDLLDGSNKSKFVIYSLYFEQVHKPCKKHDGYVEVREVSDKIIPTSLFISKLKEFGALKKVNHGGEWDGGIAIQPSNKQWFLWLQEYPVNYNNEDVYEYWEFEGLE